MSESNYAYAGLVQNVFGDWVDPGEQAYQAPAGRSIVVTAAMRRADAELQAARAKVWVSAWPIRDTLRVENLRKPKPVGKPCAGGCGKPIALQAKYPICLACRLRCVRGCGAVIDRNNRRAGVCRRCVAKERLAAAESKPAMLRQVSPYQAPAGQAPARQARAKVAAASVVRPAARAVRAPAVPKPALPVCATPECVRRVYVGHLHQHCGRCRQALKRGFNPFAERPVCRQEGCSKKLRRGRIQRSDGLCAKHGGRADVAASGRKGYHAKLTKLHGVKCAKCGKGVKRGTKTGLCKRCAALNRSRLTHLAAKTREEFAADRTWARLSVQDKWAVLNDSAAAGQVQA